ncbi:hypothetical protein [Methanococcoides sp. FTZ1]|uniref:hypothetical protein n=1 Tax=Methanococcoides sp. FTZ1 TaxID=3439061 RepID=UPI003F870780
MMIKLRMQKKKTLHESVIDAVKQSYGDIPIQVTGNEDDLSVIVETTDADVVKQQDLQVRLAEVFAKRDLDLEVVEFEVKDANSIPIDSPEI